jgi:hypothetical protein
MVAPRKYANAAARQAAYRQRLAARLGPEPGGPIPVAAGYGRWRAIRNRCVCMLDSAAAEMGSYAHSRSDAWQDSERAEAFAQMMESISEIAAALKDIEML